MSDSIIQTGEIVIHVNKDGVKPSLNEVKEEFRKGATDAESSSERIKKSLEKVKEGFGKRSALGESLEILRGAGAVAGIAILGEVLKDATGKAAELSAEFRNGEIGAKGLAEGIVRSLPIIGSFYEVGQNIRELITGEKAAVEAQNLEINRGNELYKERVKILEQQHESRKRAEDKMGDAGFRLQQDEATPGIARQLEQKKDQLSKQTNDLNYEMSPIQNEKRMRDATQPLYDEYLKGVDEINHNDKLSGEEKQGKGDELEKAYNEKREMAVAGVEKLNDELAQRNKATITILEKANALEVKELTSGAEEQFRIRTEAASKLSETKDAKLEDFRAQQQHAGYTGQALQNLVDAKSESLHADAMKGTRDQLRSLQEQYRSSEATTFSEKVKANRIALEEEARTGKITTESIDDLNQAFADLQHVQVDNKLKDAAQAIQDVGKTDIERQVTALEKLGANAKEAWKYAHDLKEALTLNDIHALDNQRALVGLNPLQAAKAAANQKGEDGDKVAAATGQLLGKELTEEMKSPFDKFRDTIDYYKELLRAGDIKQTTFQQLQLKAFEGLVDQTTHSDIDTFARDSIAKQFAGAGVLAAMNVTNNKMPAVNNINNKNAKDKEKKEKDKEDQKSKSLDNNTSAMTNLNTSINDLTDAVDNGIIAVYA